MKIALDSNSLTFLIQAMWSASPPSPPIGEEQIALLRCFLYLPMTFAVPPTVIKEYSKISDLTELKKHEGTHLSLLHDLLPDKESTVFLRTRELQNFHQKEKDCRILAECETGKSNVLLSYDRDFVNRLKNHAKLRLSFPSDFWTLLDIRPGTAPVKSPSESNPLSKQTWWIW